MAIWVGVDVGGTFTDFVAYDDDSGDSVTYKRSSTPRDPTDAIIDGLKVMLTRFGITKIPSLRWAMARRWARTR